MLIIYADCSRVSGDINSRCIKNNLRQNSITSCIKNIVKFCAANDTDFGSRYRSRLRRPRRSACFGVAMDPFGTYSRDRSTLANDPVIERRDTSSERNMNTNPNPDRCGPTPERTKAKVTAAYQTKSGFRDDRNSFRQAISDGKIVCVSWLRIQKNPSVCHRNKVFMIFVVCTLRVELSCIRRRTRWSVTTAPDNGSRVLEKLSLQPALEGAQRQFGVRSEGSRLFQVAGPNTAELRWPVYHADYVQSSFIKQSCPLLLVVQGRSSTQTWVLSLSLGGLGRENAEFVWK